MLAFCCLVVGCVLTTVSQSALLSETEWLNPIFTGCGFVFMMVAGLYSFLNIIGPLIY